VERINCFRSEEDLVRLPGHELLLEQYHLSKG